MQMQAGIVSGYHEQRKFGWERKSRIWDGKKWVLAEEYDASGPDESINPDTGYEYGGTGFVKGVKRAQQVTRNILDKASNIIPEPIKDAFRVPEETVGGLLHQGANVYNLLPENTKGNIESTATSLFETLEKSNLGYARMFDLHPDITSTALNLGEMAISGGLPSLAKKQFGKQYLKKAFTATKLTSLDNLGFSTVNIYDNHLLSSSAAITQKDGSLFSNLSKIEIQTPFSNIKKGMSVSESIKAAGSTKWFNKISKRYQYLKPADIVQDKNLIKLLKQNEHVLVGYNNKLKDLLDTKNSLLKQYPDYKTRPKDIINKIKNLDDTIGETKKFITETAGANPFLTGGGNVRIYGKGIRKYIKKNFPEFDDNLNRWHHINGSADIGKSHLTKLTQDPWVKVNLFKHMEKNDIFSSGTINNLALIKETPHNKLHAAAKKLGIEPTHFVEKLNRWSNTELTFYQYIEDISKEVLAGNADINELFTMFESYSKAMKQINNELFETFGAKRFKDVNGLVEFVSQSKVAPSVIERQAIKKVTND